MAGGFLDEVLQQGFLQNEHITGRMATAGPVRVQLQIRNPARIVQLHAEFVELVVIVARGHIVVHDGDVRAGLDVLIHHIPEGGVENGMAPREDHIALGAAAYITQHGA
ncbi:hypothetical protein SDC9_211557 [bioreactor metagenome]|uniref:Uncharacterized protein n=1 Tax=bioreactor metagenome TaxID=1076179 RepID=A0A645JJP2_9ZZZZ